MAYLNGTFQHELNGSPPLTPTGTSTHMPEPRFTPERLQDIKQQLIEPFDPAEIKWRVTATSTQQTKHGPQKRGQLIAYADQRAYTDRLNDVFGEWGWTRNYDVQVAQNFERRAASDKTQTSVAAKVVVVSRVTIHGLGTHTGVGEEWADDENAATRAEAQAFKRACACFGLGRYLYDLDKMWVDIDQHNRPAYTPSLSDWAMPNHTRKDTCHSMPQRGNFVPRQGLVQQETLVRVNELCGKVGHSLSRFILQKYACVTDPSKIGFAKLTNVLDKLTDIENGIVRLRKARSSIGEARYSSICRELNLASESIDDIQDRDALSLLLKRTESEASGKSIKVPGESSRDGIATARGRLLQAARKVADMTRRRLADVIEEASVGKLSLDELKNLTDANVPEVEAATARLHERR